MNERKFFFQKKKQIRICIIIIIICSFTNHPIIAKLWIIWILAMNKKKFLVFNGRVCVCVVGVLFFSQINFHSIPNLPLPLQLGMAIKREREKKNFRFFFSLLWFCQILFSIINFHYLIYLISIIRRKKNSRQKNKENIHLATNDGALLHTFVTIE